MSGTSGDNSDEAQAAIDEAAAHWLVQLSDAAILAQASVLADFTRWAEADPRHAQAFERMKKTWSGIVSLASSPALEPLRRDAVDELARLRRFGRRRSAQKMGMRVGLGLASAVVLLVSAYVMVWPTTQSYATAIGERRTITLADKSVVELDADTALRVDFGWRERAIHVQKGQAFFRVAKGDSRPFVVECHDRTVTATGTAFDVAALADGLQVTLVEGHVSVGAGQTVLARLEPGDSLTTQVGQRPLLRHQSNTLALLAWRTGHLIFDDVPLPDVLTQMGHYTQTRVEVDPSLAGTEDQRRFQGRGSNRTCWSGRELLSGHRQVGPRGCRAHASTLNYRQQCQECCAQNTRERRSSRVYAVNKPR